MFGRSSKYQTRDFKAGQLIIDQGEYGDCAYLVQSGILEVFMRDSGDETIINRVEAGEIVGEMALLFDEPRSASVRGVKGGKLIVIDRSVFKQKIGLSDPTIKAMVNILSRRVLYGNHARLKEQKDVRTLLRAVRILFDNVRNDMDEVKKRLFEEKAKPHFEAFVEAVETIEGYIERDEAEVPKDLLD